MASDCTVPFSDMKVPRSLGWADEAMTAMAGIMRPEVRTKKLVVQISHSASGRGPAWVTASRGSVASKATRRYTSILPYRSAQCPIRRALMKVAVPPTR